MMISETKPANGAAPDPGKPHGEVSGVPFWFIPDQRCPRCGRRHDSAASVEGQPVPGAAMFCGGCLTLLVFGPGLLLREATPGELAAIEADPKERARYAFLRWFTQVGRDARGRRPAP